MINNDCIESDWIAEVSSRNKIKDKLLIEKVIRALVLLETLAQSDFDFVFKGGTAVMLLLNSTKRMSIDIDIITDDRDFNPLSIEKALKNKGFNGIIEDERKPNSKSKITKRHFKIFYPSKIYKESREEFILLDVHYETPYYNSILDKAIASSFVSNSREIISVKVPSAEDLLGDKLTAFAPNTIGVPYVKSSSSFTKEVIKQLFDIGTLFDYANDIKSIEKTFYNVAKAQMEYLSFHGTEKDVLNDILEVSKKLLLAKSCADFDNLQEGIKKIKPFIFSVSYNKDYALNHSSKASYLAKNILEGKSKMEKYSTDTNLLDFDVKKLDREFQRAMNRLLMTDPEAFFYWYKVLDREK